MAIRWSNDMPVEDPPTDEVPAVEPKDREGSRWAWTMALLVVLAVLTQAAGFFWGQQGVNLALGVLVFLLIADRAWRAGVDESARADAADARYDGGVARDLAAEAQEDAAEALAACRRINTDMLALVKLYHGEDDDQPTGRHGAQR